MNRALCILALGFLMALSACGPLKRLRNRNPATIDSANLTSVITVDSLLSGNDSPRVLGPFIDSSAIAQIPDTPELADDSRMAMEWWQVPLSYGTFSGKAKAHYESLAESRDFTLSVRIESGKRIWMSVVGSMLGVSMEAFRAVLTPDSMIAINRIDKEVIRGPFGDIASLFPVDGDFYTLEAILVGAKIPAVPELRRSTGGAAADTLIISGRIGAMEQIITYRLADSLMVHQSLLQSDARTELSYDDYRQDGNRRFAQRLGIALQSESGGQKLELNYTSFGFDQPVDMSISIPEKYRQR